MEDDVTNKEKVLFILCSGVMVIIVYLIIL